MISKITYLFLFTALVFGCSTGPEFDRDNENDFGSNKFLPDPPTNMSYSITDQNIVTLQWIDNSSYETGYRIYKALGDTSSFSLIEELPANSTSYVDDSENFAFPTIFRIVTITDNTESTAKEIEIYFGEMDNLTVIKDHNEIELSWSDNMSLHDGYLISRSPDTSTDILFVNSVSSLTKSIRLDTPQDGFVQEFFVTPFKIYQSDTTLNTSIKETINATGPTNIKQSLIGVDSLLVTWDDNSTFESEFQLTILINNQKSIYNIPSNIDFFSIEYPFEQGDAISSSVLAFSNKLRSPESESNPLYLTDIAPPVIDSIYTISDSELQLVIKESFPIRRRIEVLRSTNNGNYISIGFLEKGDSLFTDNSVNQDNRYSYKLNTSLSEESNETEIYYHPTLNLLRKEPGDNRWIHKFAYSKGNKLLIYASGLSEIKAEKIHFYNLKTNEKSIINSPSENINLIRINNNGDKFIIYDTRGDEEIIFLYDAIQKALIKEIRIPNLDHAVDMTFLPDNETLIISAQLQDRNTGQRTHKILRYKIATSTIDTVINDKRLFYHMDFDSNILTTLNITRPTISNYLYSIKKYAVTENEPQFISSRSINTHIGNVFDAKIRVSPSLDTLIFPSREDGFIKYNYLDNEIISDDQIYSTDAFYISPEYTLLQKHGAISVLNHSADQLSTVNEISYISNGRFFASDFLFAKELNLIIDAQSNYGGDDYIESNLRFFELSKKWIEIYVESDF